MSADVLRQAASLMRSRANGSADDALYESMHTAKCGVGQLYWANDCECEIPAFTLAVAEWLEAEASAMDSMDKFTAVTSDLVREEKFNIRGAAMTVSLGKNGSIGIKADTSTPALAVARAYLGGDA